VSISWQAAIEDSRGHGPQDDTPEYMRMMQQGLFDFLAKARSKNVEELGAEK
jgi:hypothetical protein